MAPFSTWFNERIAHTPEDLQNGDGCHPDEAQALSDYFNNSITSKEAAKRITAPVLNEPKPADKTHRLWALLSDAMVELDEEARLKTLDLLSQIRDLPSGPNIQWSELPGLGAMWDDLWRLHLHGPDPWEKSSASFDEETVKSLRQIHEAIGRAESEMLIRGFNMVTGACIAYKVLDLTLSNRAGLDIFMSEIFARLDVAGRMLKDKAMSEDGLTESWAKWKEALLRLSQEGSRLSEEGRKIAGRSYDLM